jgi:phospholipase/carboxylesterase
MNQFRSSRREALFGALSMLAGACRGSAASEVTPSDAQAEAEADDLQYATGGDLSDDDRGGTTIVMLHGFGASGDDLISLARALVHTKTRYIVCAGPIQLANGGRAWWPMRGRPRYDENQVLAAPEAELRSARGAVLKLIHKLQKTYAPQSLALLGFSQGAMLALDVAVSASARVDRVAVLSGALLADTLNQLARKSHAAPAVFVSHGRQDTVLTFRGASQLVDTLKARAFRPEFHPFEGGHEIPEEILPELKAFLFNGSSPQ